MYYLPLRFLNYKSRVYKIFSTFAGCGYVINLLVLVLALIVVVDIIWFKVMDENFELKCNRRWFWVFQLTRTGELLLMDDDDLFLMYLILNSG